MVVGGVGVRGTQETPIAIEQSPSVQVSLALLCLLLPPPSANASPSALPQQAITL